MATFVALLAAAPSLLWMARGPAFLTDDFGHALAFQREGLFGGALERSFESTSRPLVGPYYLAVYGVLGERPVIHAAVMALGNVLVAVLVGLVAYRFTGWRSSLVAAVLVASAPNRSSTRLWFATGNYLFATALVLVGLALLTRTRPLRWQAAMCFAAGVALFEGTAGLTAAVLLLWSLMDVSGRLRTALLVGAPAGVIAAWMYVSSPKRGSSSPTPIESLETLPHGIFGAGLWGGRLGAVGLIAFLAAGTVALARLLPSFRNESEGWCVMRAGLLVAGVASVPFVVGGSPFAVAGIFDRSNLVPMLGVAVVFAGLLEVVHGWRPRLWLPTLVALAGSWSLMGVGDVDDYAAAATTGQMIFEHVLADVEDPSSTVVVPPAPGNAGVAAFIYPTDLANALELRGHDELRNLLHPWNVSQCREFAAQPGRTKMYDWRNRALERASAGRCD